MKVRLPVLSAVLAVFSLAAEAPKVSNETLRGYQALHKMTSTPRSVSAELAALCALSPEAKRTGPHFGHYVNVYMNEPAQTHFAAHAETAYPPGSIVIKEKLEASPKEPSVQGVAGLIKHEAGYNPKTGDWEFFFYWQGGEIQRGTGAKLAGCANCHHEAHADYVFGDFAKPPVKPAQPAL